MSDDGKDGKQLSPVVEKLTIPEKHGRIVMQWSPHLRSVVMVVFFLPPHPVLRCGCGVAAKLGKRSKTIKGLKGSKQGMVVT